MKCHVFLQIAAINLGEIRTLTIRWGARPLIYFKTIEEEAAERDEVIRAFALDGSLH